MNMQTGKTAALAALIGGLLSSVSPRLAVTAELRTPATFDHQVTGVSVDQSGRVFVNFPRWTDDAPLSAGVKRLDCAIAGWCWPVVTTTSRASSARKAAMKKPAITFRRL